MPLILQTQVSSVCPDGNICGPTTRLLTSSQLNKIANIQNWGWVGALKTREGEETICCLKGSADSKRQNTLVLVLALDFNRPLLLDI